MNQRNALFALVSLPITLSVLFLAWGSVSHAPTVENQVSQATTADISTSTTRLVAPLPPEPHKEDKAIKEQTEVFTEYNTEPPPVADSKVPVTEAHTSSATSLTPETHESISFDAAHTVASAALVNILCASTPNSGIGGATGSGVIIDPRGVILTNAHVAQYVLLQTHAHLPFSCVIRTGSPAQSRYTAEVLFFPEAWAQEHGSDIRKKDPAGTGEHDWALLYITGTTNGSEKPSVFPFLQVNTTHGAVVTSENVLLSSYPAGFLGSATLQKNLWAISTIVQIQKVYTFSGPVIELLSLGGAIVAQGGSSGGAVVNTLGQLVGIIVTSSLGETTDERDLRGLTLFHINESIESHTGMSLETFLAEGRFIERVSDFKAKSIPALLGYFPL